jgi:hypothetical protein
MLCHHIAFDFNHILCKNYASVSILSRDIFVSLFKESDGGVHWHKYPCHVAILHSSVVASVKSEKFTLKGIISICYAPQILDNLGVKKLINFVNTVVI